MQVVPHDDSAARVGAGRVAGEHPLPAPRLGCARVLDRQCIGQPHLARAGGQILVVQCLPPRDVFSERQQKVLGQDRHPVLAALAITDHDLAPLEVDVFHAQPQALQQAHAGAIEQRGHQPHRPVQLVQQRAHLSLRQHHRQPARGLGAHHLVQPRQLQRQHHPVQEQQCRLRLVLRRRRHIALHRQVRQERRHLGGPQVLRMAFAMEQDEPARPIRIGIFGANGIVPQADRPAQPVEQARRLGAHRLLKVRRRNVRRLGCDTSSRAGGQSAIGNLAMSGRGRGSGA